MMLEMSSAEHRFAGMRWRTHWRHCVARHDGHHGLVACLTSCVAAAGLVERLATRRSSSRQLSGRPPSLGLSGLPSIWMLSKQASWLIGSAWREYYLPVTTALGPCRNENFCFLVGFTRLPCTPWNLWSLMVQNYRLSHHHHGFAFLNGTCKHRTQALAVDAHVVGQAVIYLSPLYG